MTFTSRLVNFFSSALLRGKLRKPIYIYIYIYIYIAAVGLSVFPLHAEAAPRELIYQGRILRPDGSPLEGNIDFLVKIYSPAPSKCLLWAERQTLTMHGSMGAFSLDIGKPAHRLNGGEAGGATSFGQVFINHPGLTINSTQCNAGFTSYTPGANDERTVSVSFSDAGREIRVVDLPVKSVPFAMQAEQISGYSVNSLFKIAGTAQPGDKPSSLFARDGVDLLWEIAHNQDFSGKPLKNLGEPVVNSDAATKSYVDSLISQGSLGVITNVTGDVNILAGTIGTVRSLSLGTTGVTAGVYGAVGPSGGLTGVSVPVLTVDMWGRITSASQQPLPLATTGGGFGLITVDASNGLTLNSGTLGLNLSDLSGVNFGPQDQNVVLAGPLSGGTGTVSFRALDEADIPQLASTGKVQNSATSATPALTNDAIIARDAVGGFKASGAFLNYIALDNGLQAGTSSAILLSAPMGSNSYSLVFPGTAPQNGDLLSFDSSGQMSWVQPGSSGLTSLEMIVPTAEMTISGPVGPGDGTLSLSWKNQNAGLVFAAPTGASGQPSFRQLAASDLATGTLGLSQIPDLDAAKITTGTFDLARIPDLDAAKITSGTFDVARIPDLSAVKITSGTLSLQRGGTGLDGSAATTGQLLIGNGTGGFSLGHLVGGPGVSVTNQAGSITISTSGGTLGWAQGGNSFGQTGTLGTNDNQALALQTNGSIRVAIANDGKVGIGTTSPTAHLDIYGGAGKGRFTFNSNINPVLTIEDDSTSGYYPSIQFKGVGGVIGTFTGYAGTGMRYTFKEHYFANANGSTNYMTINQTGNVGIGTTAPSGRLHVEGGEIIVGPIAAGSGNSGRIQLRGLASNGTNGVSLRAPDALAANYTLTLPAVTGVSGQFLVTDAGGNLNWVTNSGGSLNWAQGGNSFGQTGTLGTNDNHALALQTNGSIRMAIAEDGRIGMGAITPDAELHVSHQGWATIKTSSGTSSVELAFQSDGAVGHDGSIIYGRDKAFRFFTDRANSSSAKMQIDASGNTSLGYGTTAVTARLAVNGNVGIGTTNPQRVLHTASTSNALRMDRGDGVVPFHLLIAYPDATYGTPTQSWRYGGISSGASLDFGIEDMGTAVHGNGTLRLVIKTSTGNVGIGVTAPTTTLQVAGVISPSDDNTHDLGTATLRFKNIYAANATIQTSDLRQKKDVEDSDLGLDFIGKLRPVSFKWITGSDTERHYGLIAQNIETAIHESRLEAGGSPSDSPGIVTHDADSDRYGVRYTELIAPVIKAIQELYREVMGHDRRLAAQEREIESLKAKNAKLEQENLEMKARLDKIEKRLESR